MSYKTIKAAEADGWRELRHWEYGGEEIIVKTHRLVKHQKSAVSQSFWNRLGFEIRSDEVPHSTRCNRMGGSTGKMVEYPVYRDDQVFHYESGQGLYEWIQSN